MNEKITEYELVVIEEPFCDIPAKSKGVVLMVYDGSRHVEVEFADITCKEISYTVPIDIISPYRDNNLA